MKLLDLTLLTPEENLACDEALLNWCEEGYSDEILRFWTSYEYFVVLGYTNKRFVEANVAVCQHKQIPILRRCSGGGTVLQGPGCLNYSLILRIPESGPLSNLSGTNDYVMQRNANALSELMSTPAQRQGFTDLTWEELKFSGNAQRRKQKFLLFHGTFLLDFNLELISQVLRMPSKQPEYRHHRNHDEFLVNLYIEPDEVKAALCAAWGADENLHELPHEHIQQLMQDKYSRDDWHWKF